MKRLLTAALLALSSMAFGATLTPIQLLNPAGSSSGQAIVSTGPSSAPAWGSVNATTLNGATFAVPGPIGSTTASSGAFTTLSATSAITPSQTAGIVGTTTNNNAAAGSVGEFISASVATGSAVALTTGTPINITSISLTAGDWDVSCVGATNPAGTTVTSGMQVSISTTSATHQSLAGGSSLIVSMPSTAGAIASAGIPPVRLSLAATTTVYMVMSASFTTSTLGGYGIIRARRIR